MKNTLRGLAYFVALLAALTYAHKARGQTTSGWGEPEKAREALPRVVTMPPPIVYAGQMRPINITTPELFPKTLAERAWVTSGVVGFNIPLDTPRPKDVDYDISLHFGGWTDHDKSGKCVRNGTLCVEYKERNPIVGVTIWFGNVAGGRGFSEVARVMTNSLGGTTDWAMVGVKWKLHRGRFADVCAAGGVAHIKARLPYSVPGLDSSQADTRFAGYMCLERGPVALRFTPLTKKDWFINVVYSFDLN